MRGSALGNEEIATVMTKASQGMSAPLTSPACPIFLNLLLSPGAALVEPLHVLLGWEAPACFPGVLLPTLPWAGGGFSVQALAVCSAPRETRASLLL